MAEDLWELILSYSAGPRNEIQVVWLCTKYLSLLSRLSSPDFSIIEVFPPHSYLIVSHLKERLSPLFPDILNIFAAYLQISGIQQTTSDPHPLFKDLCLIVQSPWQSTQLQEPLQ